MRNVTFQNTATPVTIQGPSATEPNQILVDNCHFYNGSISIDSRPNVLINGCDITYNSGLEMINGIACTNSDNVTIQGNTLDFTQFPAPSFGIVTVWGNGINIVSNTITGASGGIFLSNNSPFVEYNAITNSDPNTAQTGMGLDNAYSPEIKYNTISGYQTGFYMTNSSPVMYSNSSLYDGTVGAWNTVQGLGATYNSYPILAPSGDGPITILEAGNNILRANQLGMGIYVEYGRPILDYGTNTIYGRDYYLYGIAGSPDPNWYVRCNDWVDNPPDLNKFQVFDQTVVYDPSNCGAIGGGGLRSKPDILNPDPPPPPIIVNHGVIFDTIRVVTHTLNQSPDRQLLSQGSSQILFGNYASAVNTFMQLVQNYQDSSTAINAMVKILYCKDKMNADSNAYNTLRSYYLNLAQANPTDTAFVKAARELAEKCVVRKKQYPSAITGYEAIVNNSNDSLEILCAELNIIETYMLIHNGGGNAPSFTGQLSQLKPASIKDGIKMIMQKLYRFKDVVKNNPVPEEFKLSQNYPNPFNAMTKINFALPNKSNVSLKVYDILGRLVATLVNNEFKDAGYHSITFDATNLASGIYFYRIEAGKYIDAKKMVVVK